MSQATRIVENWSKKVAARLWPLQMTTKGGNDDCNGIDAYLFGEPVQIKGDRQIINSDKIYHEIYSKNKGHPEEEWKCSPQNARYYIFVAHDQALITKLDDLAELEKGKKMQSITDKDTGRVTSMGFLIPRYLFNYNSGTFKDVPWEYQKFPHRQERLIR